MGHYDEFRDAGEGIDWPLNEGRMDVIGQNGNNGEHYPPKDKYVRSVKGVKADVYDVLVAFSVTNPALQHAIKKMLCTGIRGYKDFNQDIDETIQALERAKEIQKGF